jgi:hypothetical protein
MIKKLFKAKKGEWCCKGFESSFAEAGQRGFGIIIQEGTLNDFMFTLQHRCLDPGARIPSLDPGVALSLISEMTLKYCPWCGQDLKKWYSSWAVQLLRPEFEMESRKPSKS